MVPIQFCYVKSFLVHRLTCPVQSSHGDLLLTTGYIYIEIYRYIDRINLVLYELVADILSTLNLGTNQTCFAGNFTV